MVGRTMTGRCLLLALTIFFLSCPSRAADSPPFLEWPATALDPSNGLPQSVVTSLSVDGEGLVWIGTQEGLRFSDGLHVFEDGIDPYLLSASIDEVVYHPASGLWVLAGGKLWNKSEGHWSSTAFNSNNRVYALKRDGLVLWVGTTDGLWRGTWSAKHRRMAWTLAGNGLRPVLHLAVSEDSLATTNTERWVVYKKLGKELKTVSTGSINATGFSRLFFYNRSLCGQAMNGVVCVDPNRPENKSKIVPCLPFEQLSYLGQSVEISRCGVKTRSDKQHQMLWRIRLAGKPSYLNATFTSAMNAPDGSLWLGTFGAGALRLHPGLLASRVWLSSEMVSVLDDQMQVIRADVTGLTKWDGELLLATRNRGLLALNPASGESHTFRGPVKDGQALTYFEDVARGSFNEVWASAGEQGLWCAVNKSWQPISLGRTQEETWIFQIAPTKGGLVIAGLGGIWRLKTSSACVVEKIERMPLPERVLVNSDRFSTLCLTPDGGIWAGGEMGLFHWTPQLFNADPVPLESWKFPDVHHVRCEPDGDVWVASSDGIARIWEGRNGREMDRYADVRELAGRAAYAVATDGHGKLWVGTSRGPLLLDPTRRLIVARGYTWPRGFGEVNPKAVYWDESEGTLYLGLVSGAMALSRPPELFHARAVPRALISQTAGESLTSIQRLKRSFRWDLRNTQVVLIGAISGDVDALEVGTREGGAWHAMTPMNLQHVFRQKEPRPLFLRTVNWRLNKQVVTGPYLPRVNERSWLPAWWPWMAAFGFLTVIGMALWRILKGYHEKLFLMDIELRRHMEEKAGLETELKTSKQAYECLEAQLKSARRSASEVSASLSNLGLFDDREQWYTSGFAEWVLPRIMSRQLEAARSGPEDLWMCIQIGFKAKQQILREMGVAVWKGCLKEAAGRVQEIQPDGSYLCLTAHATLLLCVRCADVAQAVAWLHRAARACANVHVGGSIYERVNAEPHVTGMFWPLRSSWRSEDDARVALNLLLALADNHELFESETVALLELGDGNVLRHELSSALQNLPAAIKNGKLKVTVRTLTEIP